MREKRQSRARCWDDHDCGEFAEILRYLLGVDQGLGGGGELRPGAAIFVLCWVGERLRDGGACGSPVFRPDLRPMCRAPFWRHFLARSGRTEAEREESGRKCETAEAAVVIGKTTCRRPASVHGSQSSNPFPATRQRRGLTGVAECAEGIPYQSLDLLKKLSRGLAIPPKHTERCCKEIGRRVGPHRFPMLGDGQYGQCAQCVWSAFAGPRGSKPLRLGARLVGPCCLPRA